MNIFQYQNRVSNWMIKCFSRQTRENKRERAFRFMEEALELFQSVGGTQEDVKELSAYVFGRPVGETAQEVGGVMTTLAALCTAAEIDLGAATVVELHRINTPKVIEKIQGKRATQAVPGDYTSAE